MDPSALLFPLLVLGAFYLLLVRPQQKRIRKHQELLKDLQPGDEVVTVGGMYAHIKQMEGPVVWLDAGDGTLLKFSRQAIREKVRPEEPDAEGSAGTEAV